MAEKLQIKTVATYNGHNVRANKSVDISFKFSYGDLVEYIKTIQMLNENVKIVVKQHDSKAKMLGIFMVKDIHVDHDGEGRIKFNSMVDQSEVQLMHLLANNEPFKILLEAEIEQEELEEEWNAKLQRIIKS